MEQKDDSESVVGEADIPQKTKSTCSTVSVLPKLSTCVEDLVALSTSSEGPGKNLMPATCSVSTVNLASLLPNIFLTMPDDLKLANKTYFESLVSSNTSLHLKINTIASSRVKYDAGLMYTFPESCLINVQQQKHNGSPKFQMSIVNRETLDVHNHRVNGESSSNMKLAKLGSLVVNDETVKTLGEQTSSTEYLCRNGMLQVVQRDSQEIRKLSVDPLLALNGIVLNLQQYHVNSLYPSCSSYQRCNQLRDGQISKCLLSLKKHLSDVKKLNKSTNQVNVAEPSVFHTQCIGLDEVRDEQNTNRRSTNEKSASIKVQPTNESVIATITVNNQGNFCMPLTLNKAQSEEETFSVCTSTIAQDNQVLERKNCFAVMHEATRKRKFENVSDVTTNAVTSAKVALLSRKKCKPLDRKLNVDGDFRKNEGPVVQKRVYGFDASHATSNNSVCHIRSVAELCEKVNLESRGQGDTKEVLERKNCSMLSESTRNIENSSGVSRITSVTTSDKGTLLTSKKQKTCNKTRTVLQLLTEERQILQKKHNDLDVSQKSKTRKPRKKRRTVLQLLTEERRMLQKKHHDLDVSQKSSNSVMHSKPQVRNAIVRTNKIVSEVAAVFCRKPDDLRNERCDDVTSGTSGKRPLEAVEETPDEASGSRFKSEKTSQRPDESNKRKRLKKERRKVGPRQSKRLDRKSDNNRIVSGSIENHPQTAPTIAIPLLSDKVKVFETWDDWFKAVMSLKSVITVKEMLSEDVLRCFYKCMSRHCIFATDDTEEFADHLQKSHAPQETIYCYFCLRSFVAVEHLLWHMTSAHGTRRYQCNGCPYRASSRNHLDFHCNDFHDADYFRCRQPSSLDYCITNDQPTQYRDIKMYRCAVGGCSYSTPFSRLFFEHSRTRHCDTLSFPCGYCSFECSKVSILLQHYHEHDVYEYECAHCNYGCRSESHIMRHLCLTHPDQKLVLVCRVSEDSYLAEDSVPEFVPNYSRNLSCAISGCAFKAWNVSAYRNHLSAVHQHISTRYFPCPHCSRKLKNSQELEEHIYMHSPNLYRCSRCGFLHWQVRMLSNHFLREHGAMKCQMIVIRQLQDSVPTPIATLMPSSEQSEDELIVVDDEGGRPVDEGSAVVSEDEFIVVDDEQPVTDGDVLPSAATEFIAELQSSSKLFVCSICDTVFYLKMDLLTHYRYKHSYRRAIQCIICQELLSSKSVRNLHMRLHHNLTEEISLNKNSSLIWCFRCHYKTRKQHHMKEHIYKEINYFPFLCTLCSFGNKRKPYVTEHCQSVHKRNCWTEKRDSRTESWVKDFLSKVRLKASDTQELSPDGSYICVFCKSSITSFRRYRFHLFRHLQYKRYSCKLCHDEFFGKSSARKHSLRVHGVTLKHTHASLRLPRIEEWIAEKMIENRLSAARTQVTATSPVKTLADLDLTQVYLRLPTPRTPNKIVTVSEGLKMMNMDVQVKIQRVDMCDFESL